MDGSASDSGDGETPPPQGEEESLDEEEECRRAQADEVCVLEAIYPDEFRRLSSGGGGRRRPVAYQIRVSEGEESEGGAAGLVVEYPAGYPDRAPPRLRLATREGEGAGGEEDDLGEEDAALLRAMRRAVEPGTPCILQCLHAGREHLEARRRRREAAAHEAREEPSPPGAREAPPLGALVSQRRRVAQIHPPTAFDSDVPDALVQEGLPRALLRALLYEHGGVRERGRLSVASRCLRDFVERRARRALAALPARARANEWEWWHRDDDDDRDGEGGGGGLPRSATIDGVRYEGWTLDLRRAETEREARTCHERLWRTQRTMRFRLGGHRDHRPVLFDGTGDINDSDNRGSSHRWDYHSFSWKSGGYVFGCARALALLPRAAAGERDGRCYRVRVRLRGRLPEDGDVFVGLIHERMLPTREGASPPRAHFDLVPGGGFGVASEGCVLVNVLSGDNPPPRWHPTEVNLGLKIRGGGAPTVGYGVPKATRGAATRGGGPVHNDGVVWSRLRRPAGEPAGDARDGDVFLAAAVAHTRAQDLDVAVSVEECSRREWNRQFRVPCEDLWHLDMF